MGLNKSKGNMYDFITHTWNTVKGECYHDCSYCYMKRWGKLNPVRFDEKELKADLGSGNFIFVGSSCDMFADNIPHLWIEKTLKHCAKFDNKYLIQTKNPSRVLGYQLPDNFVVCTTIETNRYYPECMVKSPTPAERVFCIEDLCLNHKTYITIEPIMDFDLEEFSNLIELCIPEQVNIGADTSKSNLPEPSKEKILQLIERLEKFTIVHKKSNLKRLLK